MIDGVVAPVLHTLPVVSDEVNTTLPPWQKVVGPPGVMEAIGKEFTVTLSEVEAEQLFPSVTVTK